MNERPTRAPVGRLRKSMRGQTQPGRDNEVETVIIDRMDDGDDDELVSVSHTSISSADASISIGD